MASKRNQSMNGAQVMVGMAELQDVLNALHQAANGNTASVFTMTSRRNYPDPANPLRRLINQYNASVELSALPVDGEA